METDYLPEVLYLSREDAAALGSQVWLTASTGSSSYVISTGGWSGNPFPSFTSEPEAESESSEEIIPEEIFTDLPEMIPEQIETAPDIPEYENAPETAPF